MSVSKSLMEAAQIDGCTKTQATINVTIPPEIFLLYSVFSLQSQDALWYDKPFLDKKNHFNSSVMAAMHVYNRRLLTKIMVPARQRVNSVCCLRNRKLLGTHW